MLLVRPDRPRGPTCLMFNAHQVFLGVKQRDVVLTVHPIIKPRCEWVEALPPPPLCARIGISRVDLHCNKYLFVNYLFK
jgi:hypothetical protein